MIVFKILYYCFNLIVGSIIGLITWIPRILLNRLFDVKTNIFSWLDRNFPLPDDNELFKAIDKTIPKHNPKSF